MSIKLDGIKEFDLFHSFYWSNLLEQDAPFIPEPDDETDTGYFDARLNSKYLYENSNCFLQYKSDNVLDGESVTTKSTMST